MLGVSGWVFGVLFSSLIHAKGISHFLKKKAPAAKKKKQNGFDIIPCSFTLFLAQMKQNLPLDDPLLTVTDIHKRYKVGRPAIYRAIADGRLVGLRLGKSGPIGKYRFKLSDVEAWIAKSYIVPADTTATVIEDDPFQI